MQHSPIQTPAGHNLPPYWFADPRALEIVADVIATEGKCLGQRSHEFHAAFASQREMGVIFTGPLVDELQAIRKAALPLIDEAIDWHNEAHISYYRTQKVAVTDMLLAALDWRPNGGGGHDRAVVAFFNAVAAARVAA